MTQKHSESPWRADKHGIRNNGGYICALNWPHHYDGQDERFKQEMAEREFDAALIARAPDLLADNERLRQVNAELVAALKVALPSISVAGLPEDLELARAALSRAKGEK